MRVVLVIPALNEEATIAEVIARVPKSLVEHVVVVDGGSQDRTAARAQRAGATVVRETRPGYGRACMRGVEHARSLGAEAVAFVDAALCEDPAELDRVLDPVLRDDIELSVGSRTRGRLEPGALRPVQRAGNRLVTWLIGRRTGVCYSDLGSMRAIRLGALDRLGLRELAHGWPTEMQVSAAIHGLRIREVPVSYRNRRAGASKVSGSLRGAARAGVAMVRVALWGHRE